MALAIASAAVRGRAVVLAVVLAVLFGGPVSHCLGLLLPLQVVRGMQS